MAPYKIIIIGRLLTVTLDNYPQVFVLGDKLGAHIKSTSQSDILRLINGIWVEQDVDPGLNSAFVSNGQLVLLRFNWVRVRNSEFMVTSSVTDYSFTDKEGFYNSLY